MNHSYIGSPGDNQARPLDLTAALTELATRDGRTLATATAATLVDGATTPLSVAEISPEDTTNLVRFTRQQRLRATNEIRGVLLVKSGGFACEQPFAIGEANLRVAVQRLRDLQGRTTNSVFLRNCWNDDFLRWKREAQGQVWVTGQLSGTSGKEEQKLCFAFRADSRFLIPFADALMRLLDS
jgi:hypothetical protein